MEKQRTLQKSVAFSGTGLHTGNPSTITFHPAPANYGYVFVRTDLETPVEIPALVDFVVDLSRGTTLGIDGVRVHTVEHVLAALAGLRIDNCRIELSSNEPPVIDGSSMPYVNALLEAGITELNAEREYFVIDEAIRYTNEEKHVDIVALPNNDYRITVMIDYFNPALGSQHTGMFDLEKEFVSEFAPARTFCFLTEVMELHKQGLIKGGSLDSAIVIIDKEMSSDELGELKKIFRLNGVPNLGENGILNGTHLRFKNEPVRHKLLDMIGDLTLIGVPLKSQILAARPGHASNIEFAKLIRAKYLEHRAKFKKHNPTDKKTLDINDIMKVLPHRYPFLLIDRIVSIDDENSIIIGLKNVTINEPFFGGHFPDKPVMPGVLILEALAQVGGLMITRKVDNIDNKLAFFMGIKNAKFRKPVFPGDQLIMEVKLISKRLNTFLFEGKAMVDGQIVAEAEFQAALVDK
ncbi:MAG: bifunctional UDP-3-O-[3-hydroxymyristoyl] N-acetylglucosamine deacetylase/3-hydroxyacyl-ACP dehydratase [Desulfobulbaceae bacterium]|nr:bifunctional UDP-3-O-[3-hydroxymyristoyl] N-acetylglucosamine deacetylase/3-hydroxyacyl-ACP dehydratase [Candidatus Kapabacteria bacterium]MBS3999647.1 bifunctional UDP-3-O-[3-hydroxymyristoyl] N-acetylglucosamine deacetylase/3-hydroxyacyl-ACP dehydratase [Desulfobulbaceae bacterium]